MPAAITRTSASFGPGCGVSMASTWNAFSGSPYRSGRVESWIKLKCGKSDTFPIVAFVDTSGAFPGAGAEERGIAWAIAENLVALSAARIPILTLVIGEGGSGGALGIGVGDRLLMMEHSIYSVAMPEACASILWRDIAKKVEAADALKLTAADLKRLGLADEIIPEPPGGAQNDYGLAADAAAAALRRHLKSLEAIDTDQLVEERYQRYRKIGATP